jgi:hypothetical protein
LACIPNRPKSPAPTGIFGAGITGSGFGFGFGFGFGIGFGIGFGFGVGVGFGVGFGVFGFDELLELDDDVEMAITPDMITARRGRSSHHHEVCLSFTRRVIFCL